MKISKKTRQRFKEHNLVLNPSMGTTSGKPWINEGRLSHLFECDEHCDWLGWIPSDEWKALMKEKK
jgi:hypothetical protein